MIYLYALTVLDLILSIGIIVAVLILIKVIRKEM